MIWPVYMPPFGVLAAVLWVGLALMVVLSWLDAHYNARAKVIEMVPGAVVVLLIALVLGR